MTTEIPAPTLPATLPASCTDGRKTVIMRVDTVPLRLQHARGTAPASSA